MKRLIKYSLLMLLSIAGFAQGASLLRQVESGVYPECNRRVGHASIAHRRLARLTGHVAAAPTVAAKKLAIATTNAQVAQGLTQDQQKEISDALDGLAVERDIFDAAKDGNVEELKKFLAIPGVDVNAKDNQGLTLLMQAARNGHLEAVKYLIGLRNTENKPLVYLNVRGVSGVTAFMLSVANGQLAVVQFLAGLRDAAGRRAIDINTKNDYGRTALMAAASLGHLSVISFLISLRDSSGRMLIDVNAKDEIGQTALMYSAKNGHLPVMELLLSLRDAAGMTIVDANGEDDEGRTPLVYAATGEQLEVVRYLVGLRDLEGRYRVDIYKRDQRGFTALTHMCSIREQYYNRPRYTEQELADIRARLNPIIALLEQADRERAQQPNQIPSRL